MTFITDIQLDEIERIILKGAVGEEKVTAREIATRIAGYLAISNISQEQKKPNRVVESMTKIVLIHYNIRLWITASETDNIDHQYIKSLLQLHCKNEQHIEPIKKLIENNVPGIAAYEILDKDGNGIVVYPDWN